METSQGVAVKPNAALQMRPNAGGEPPFGVGSNALLGGAIAPILLLPRRLDLITCIVTPMLGPISTFCFPCVSEFPGIDRKLKAPAIRTSVGGYLHIVDDEHFVIIGDETEIEPRGCSCRKPFDHRDVATRAEHVSSYDFSCQV